MKKSRLYARLLGTLVLSSMLFSCTHLNGTNGTDGIDNSGDDKMVLKDNNGVSDKDEVTGSGGGAVIIDDKFIRGFDASAVDYDEELNKTKFSDTTGSKMDFFKILAAHAFNTVRLRIFVDPDNAPVEDSYWQSGSDGWKSGNNTLERTIRMAKRAKEAGLKVLLDFFYSDYWADPGKQVIPKSWQNIATSDAMAAKVAEYTTEVLTAMINAGVAPDYVQVGNEIDSGILVHTAYKAATSSSQAKATAASSAIQGTGGSANFVKYLKAGCDAVKKTSPSTKIILHVTNRKPTNILTQSISSQLNYDIVGLSFYPFENSHGTIADLKKNIQTFRGNGYGKQVMVTEAATYFDYDSGSYTDLANVAKHMIDPATGNVYTDLETEKVNDSTLIVKGSVPNQLNTLRHIMMETAAAGGTGVFYWGGEYRGQWKYGLFDWYGKAMDSINCFNEKIPSN